jgi:hypothetical protein
MLEITNKGGEVTDQQFSQKVHSHSVLNVLSGSASRLGKVCYQIVPQEIVIGMLCREYKQHPTIFGKARHFHLHGDISIADGGRFAGRQFWIEA